MTVDHYSALIVINDHPESVNKPMEIKTMTINEYYTLVEKNHTFLYNKKGVHIVEYTFEFLWETKDEYLAFRDEWKAQYKELSARLKKAKHDLKDAHRAGGGWRESEHLMSLKSQAHMLLQMREQGKRVSREQARAQREAAA